MATDDLHDLPEWLASVLQMRVPHFGPMDRWTAISGLSRSLSIELDRAGVLPVLLIQNHKWINLWGGLAMLHRASAARQTIAVPGEARARELERKARLRAEARRIRRSAALAAE